LQQDEAIMIDDIDSPYASIPSLKAAIYARGIDRPANSPRPKGVRSEAAEFEYQLGLKKSET
jgi:hypothetical protein